MTAWQRPSGLPTVNLPLMGAYLMGVFGPWMPLLFAVGAILLVGGLRVKEMAPNPFPKGLGRAATNAGWRMMLLAAAIYLLIVVLAAVFENMLSNLPGT